MSSPWRSEIRRRLGSGAGAAGWVLLGVGNRWRGDDGAGSRLAGRLAERGVRRAIDAGAVPENYCERVAALRPRAVFIADAACFGGRPGEVRLLDPGSLGAGALSTHGVSLAPVAAYIGERCRCPVLVLGIEPSGAGDGEEVSAPVLRAVEELEDYFVGLARAAGEPA